MSLHVEHLAGIYLPAPETNMTGIILPGGGMSRRYRKDGVSHGSNPTEATRSRLVTAARFLLDHENVEVFVTGDASGMKSEQDPRYSTSERRWFTGALRAEGVHPSQVVVDTRFSSTTYGNLRNATQAPRQVKGQDTSALLRGAADRGFIETHRDNPIGVVTERGHFEKVVLFGKSLFGKTVEFEHIPSGVDTGRVSLVERAELAIYGVALAPIANGNTPVIDRTVSIVQATIFNPAKGILRAVSGGGQYS